MKKLIIIISLFLSGCIHESNTEVSNNCENDEYRFSGCWITQECRQADDGNGNLVNIWFRSEYNFKPDNSITIKMAEYSNSSCNGSVNFTDSFSEEHTIKYEYIDEVVLDDGLLADQIKIKIQSPDSELEVLGGLVVTNTEELCSSKSFYFGSGEFSIQSGGLAKDTELYENCLIKGKLP